MNRMNENSQTEKTVLKLNAPSKYSLKECLEELKFGRKAQDQRMINSFISQLECGNMLDSLDIAANDYASENPHLDLSTQYQSFIAGSLFMNEKLKSE